MSAAPELTAKPRRFLLPSAARLKTGRDFAAIKNGGRPKVRGCLIANWMQDASVGASKLGVITGKRLGPAVVRNRARRLMREAFRLHQHEFSAPVRLVLVARPSIVGKLFQEVEKDFLAVMNEARLLKAS